MFFKDEYEIQAKSFGGLKMEDMKMISMIFFQACISDNFGALDS